MSPCRRSLPGAAIVALLLAPPVAAPLAAQGVQGVVVTGDSIAVSGAAVTLLDSIGAVVVTTVTDETGYFTAKAPRLGTFQLRTEAVGFARVTSFPFTLTSTRMLIRRVQLTDATAAMRSIEVRETSRCDVRPAEGTQVARRWDEARKSFLAATASASTAPPVAFDLDEIEYDSTFLRVRAATRVTTAGRAERGFRSDDPRALRLLGYARRIDTTEVYFGPDARVLLSDEFAASHCFSIVAEDPTSMRRVGIGFAPVGTLQGKLDVTGTIWLDRETYALDRVEFRYEPILSGDFPDSTFGGRVHFARLASGHLVVSRWVLRLPIYAAADDGRVARAGMTSQMLQRSEQREVVAGVKVVRGTSRAFDSPPQPLPVINALPRRSVGAPSCANSDRIEGQAGWVGGQVNDARGRAAPLSRVRATWHQGVFSGGRLVFREMWVESGSDAAGRFALCALPVGVQVSVMAQKDNAVAKRVRFTLQPGEAAPVVELALTSVPRGTASPATGVALGQVIGRDARPVPDVEIRLFPGAERIRTDSAGRFRITDAPPGLKEFFVRRLGYAPMMGAVEIAAGDTAQVTVALEPAAQLLDAVTVTASSSSMNLDGFELRRKSGLGGTFIGPDEVRARDAGTVQTLLRSLGRGIRIEESGATGDIRIYGRMSDNLDVMGRPSSDGTVIYSDRCNMRIIVDGALMPLNSPLNMLPPLREIAAFEIYNSIGAVPPMYTFAQPECGLLVVWTRDASSP